MASYKAIVNPFTGKLTLIRADSAFHMKDSVATQNDLPLSGNTENDVRITQDDDKMYTWGISATSGLLTDWKEIGSATSVDWSAITGKPSSTPVEIDSAVTAKHTQNTDIKLDEGGANEVVVADVKDAVTKKHTQNTDTDLDATFEATFVKKVDNVNVLNDITSSGANIEDAVTKKHTQNTDIGTDSNSFIIDNNGTHNGIALTPLENLAYGSDICTGGTPSASSEQGANTADKAFDDNTGTWWNASFTSADGWIKYDLGVGNEKIAKQLRMYPTNKVFRDFLFQGSNDDLNWDTLLTIVDESNTVAWHEWAITNSTAYRYYRVYFTLTWNPDNYKGVKEIEIKELNGFDGLKVQHGDSANYGDILTKDIHTDSIKDSTGSNSSTPVNIADAVTKKHTQNTDIGTDSNSFNINNDDIVHNGVKLLHYNDFSYGSNVFTGGSATADSTYLDRVPARAFDGNLTLVWVSALIGGVHWLKYDLGNGNEKTITRIRIYDGNPADAFSSDIQGSNDDLNWDTLDSVTQAGIIDTWNTYNFVNTTAYRYYRLLFPDTGGAKTCYELEGYEPSGLDGIYLQEGDSTDFVDMKVKSVLATEIKDSVGNNSSTPANIADAVTKKHTHIGYTQLGSDAPTIKMKKFTGTTASSQGGNFTVAHGLTVSKILSVELIIEFDPNAFIGAEYGNTGGFQASINLDSTNIFIYNNSTNSGSILSKPLKILVIYEE